MVVGCGCFGYFFYFFKGVAGFGGVSRAVARMIKLEDSRFLMFVYKAARSKKGHRQDF
jgi:hypothetical protein